MDQDHRLLVAKFGTKTSESPSEREKLDKELLYQRGWEIGQLASSGCHVVVVASGDRQFGQNEVFGSWQEGLGGIAEEYFLSRLSTYKRNRILASSAKGRVPVVNMRNSELHQESLYRNNDFVGAAIASHAANSNWYPPENVCFGMFTDVDAVLDQQSEPMARVEMNQNTELSHIKNHSGSNGEGGIRTKVEAAMIAGFAGVRAWVANGREEDAIPRAMAEEIGTHFVPVGERV